MYTKVLGTPTTLKTAETRFAVRYYLGMLLKPRQTAKLRIYVNYTRKETRAGCTPLDDKKIKRIFEIDIDPRMGRRAQLLALAHECVHVAQFATRTLRECEDTGDTIFQGKRYARDPEYFEQPWEIEAYGRELGLYLRYKDVLKKNGLIF